MQGASEEEQPIKQVRVAVNQLTSNGNNLQALLNGVCRVAIEKAGYRMAWIGLGDPLQKTMRMAAAAGVVDGSLDIINVDLQNHAPCDGPCGRAWSSGKYQVCNDIKTDPLMVPWRKAALESGYRSSVAFPLIAAGKKIGVLSLYAAEPDHFDAAELTFLDQLVTGIAVAIERIRHDGH